MFINTLTENSDALLSEILEFCKIFENKLSDILLSKTKDICQKSRHIYSGNCTQEILINLSQICSLCSDCIYLLKLLDNKNELIKKYTNISKLTKKHMKTFRQMLIDNEI